MATEWGIFNDDSVDWTAEEAIESGFYSKKEAEKRLDAIRADYSNCIVHECEEPEEEEEEEEEEENDDIPDDDDDKPRRRQRADEGDENDETE